MPVAQRAASAANDGGTLNFGGGASPKPSPRPEPEYASDALERVPAPASPDPSATVPTAGGRDEMWWRSSSISHSEAVERAEAAIERCEAADDRRRDASGLTDLGACDAAKARLEVAEEKLDRFEEQARRAEVPAGWLR